MTIERVREVPLSDLVVDEEILGGPPATATVDVLVSTYNEETHVERCLRHVLEQRYPQEAVHVWVIDGGSTDRTVEIVREWERAQGRVTVIADGHRRNLPEALNVGLAEGRGELVAKVDAHGYPERDYIRRAVVTMQRAGTRVGCVGGRPLQEGETPFGRAVGLARTSRFGVGASGYASRIDRAEVDTVQCGIYRRRALLEVGGFDPAMAYGEDEELNWRLRQAGWSILLDSSIRFHYVARSTWRAAFRQYRNYGEARVRVVRKHPAFLRVHHLAPAAMVAGLAAQAALVPVSRRARRSLAWSTAAYSVAASAAAVRAVGSDRHLAPRVAAAFVALHAGYGIGTLRRVSGLAHLNGSVPYSG